MTQPEALVPTLSQLNIYLFAGYSYTCQRRWNTVHAVQADHEGLSTAPAATLPVEVVVQAVSEGLELGMRSVRLTGISGGGSDPMNYPEFDRLLDLLKYSGGGAVPAELKIDTNGDGLTAERARRLAQYANCRVGIALAGAEPGTHDTLTGVPGGFNSATRAARLLADEGLAPDILFPILRRNARQIKAVIRLAEQLGAGSLSFIAVSPFQHQAAIEPKHGSAGDIFEPLTVEELIALGRKVERQYQAQTQVKLLFDQPPAFRGLHASARLEGQSSCDATYSLSLLPDGSYTMCGMAFYGRDCADDSETGALILGNTGHERLETVWSSHPVLAALRNGMSDRLSGVCERCLVKSACLGRCPIENLQRTGSFWGPYWFCEAAERAGLFPAGRLIENYW